MVKKGSVCRCCVLFGAFCRSIVEIANSETNGNGQNIEKNDGKIEFWVLLKGFGALKGKTGKGGEVLSGPKRPAGEAKQDIKAEEQANKAAKAALHGRFCMLKRRVRTSATFRRPKTLRLARKPLYMRKSIPHTPRLDEYKVLVCPLNTESSMKKIEENNTLVFRVHLRANKYQIQLALKKLYNVDVQKNRMSLWMEINTLICPNGTKKAYVKLSSDMDALDVANKIGFV
ncbi:unnamed protein product [Pneumocystis jirovecii]|uniref:Large ribosomal subunit protein uL23 N-terminal domain-containing protein n=1 Tax=Pneumocystis jirovecii TaxID=42068 RepID=L0PE13_PNEJI|nr:unnamed protein product [Pneumocystis jirovecii]